MEEPGEKIPKPASLQCPKNNISDTTADENITHVTKCHIMSTRTPVEQPPNQGKDDTISGITKHQPEKEQVCRGKKGRWINLIIPGP
ncbi:MAG: hypothetical protein BWY45_03554 [Euryarchaeota archaeon ADurb.Bin294]|nr:MAG: hypothetical protein BWY45_03554 [Euryarchaeota archaeon ADurb.Bin294]